jgi:hypothetical protein
MILCSDNILTGSTNEGNDPESSDDAVADGSREVEEDGSISNMEVGRMVTLVSLSIINNVGIDLKVQRPSWAFKMTRQVGSNLSVSSVNRRVEGRESRVIVGGIAVKSRLGIQYIPESSMSFLGRALDSSLEYSLKPDNRSCVKDDGKDSRS